MSQNMQLDYKTLFLYQYEAQTPQDKRISVKLGKRREHYAPCWSQQTRISALAQGEQERREVPTLAQWHGGWLYKVLGLPVPSVAHQQGEKAKEFSSPGVQPEGNRCKNPMPCFAQAGSWCCCKSSTTHLSGGHRQGNQVPPFPKINQGPLFLHHLPHNPTPTLLLHAALPSLAEPYIWVCSPSRDRLPTYFRILCFERVCKPRTSRIRGCSMLWREMKVT